MSERPEVERFKTLSTLFSTLDTKGVERLASIAQTKTFKPNDTIVRVGEPAETFYVIVRGGVRVIAKGKDEGKEVARLAAGQFFGEMGILNDEPRTADVRAIGDVVCLIFTKDDLLKVLEDYPQIMHTLGAVGVERAGKLVDALEES
ncbi:MAG: cyclic nucleotide-binding domain-containing protein [Deltaproteobacteria bacterium]|nr:cyclic nucleotide-binding domain-containing protein [Deltaproteobacteria bacterium]